LILFLFAGICCDVNTDVRKRTPQFQTIKIFPELFYGNYHRSAPFHKKTFTKKITIMKKALLFIALAMIILSGSFGRTVKGFVTDNGGNPLPGVNIIIKGTTTGVISDNNGYFAINVPEGKVMLVFSYIGFARQEVEIKDSKTLAVVMEEDVARLEEVVVTGYATQKKSCVTGSVASVQCNSPSRDRRANSYYQPAPDYNTEGYSAIHENGYKNPLTEPLSTFSIDVDAASYSNVRRFINEGQKPVPDAVRIEEMINYFDYDYPQPHDGNPFAIVHELGVCPWNKENLLLHIGLQGQKLVSTEIPSSNLVFLLDVSGSMDQPNKLPLLVKAMKMLVGQLRARDRVAIVVYAGSSGMVLPSTPGNQKEKIIAALDRLQAGGSTAGSAGLKLAYEVAEENFMEDGNNRIILATDGDFNVGPSSNAEMERMIEKYRDRGIFISVCGFGMGNYKDDKMEIIADKGNGNYSYIDNLMEAKKVFVNEFSSTLYTIAKDVKIQIEFNPAIVKEYRLVGYENRLLNEEDFENDKKDAGELGAGHTVTALYEIVTTGRHTDYVRRLKYQPSAVIPEVPQTGELATIKFRYKKPDGDKSILMTEVIPQTVQSASETSDNFRFSAAVAGFGMLLRNSEYKGSINYDQVLTLARGAKGYDKDGYRSEFIRLVELSDSGLTSDNE
jgi:Ca-activated chloride channel homolog